MTEGFERLHPAVQYHVGNTLGWPALRPLQERAAAALTAGRSALLLAPTAGGKTEAALLPVFSRMLAEDWRGISVLYLSPLRALANNLEPRLAQLAGMVGRRAALWHGDVGQGERRAIGREPPDLLLATPEAVEGILAGSRTDHRQLLGGLRAVIVDELHAFAGDDRGWQLLALLCRLERIAGQPLQRVGLSATVGNPQALVAWLTAGGPDGVVVQPPAATGDAPEVKVDHVGSLENAARVIAALHRGEKRLVFCDSRARVERLAALLREGGVEAHASHSSLSADARRLAERAFAESENCVIVATSTLELGIDVGDLDRVIQIDAPATVAGFLQRLGRTGRRGGTRRNCLFLATDPDALLRVLGLLVLWRRGWVEPLVPPPRPLPVLLQQIFSLVHQEGSLAPDALPAWIGGFLAAADVGGETLAEQLRWLEQEGWLRPLDGRLWLGERAEQRFRGKRFTDLLSVFTAPELYRVQHGRVEIGQVHGASLAGADEGPTILTLGARGWRVTRADHNRRVLYVEPVAETGRSRWMGSSRHLGPEHAGAIRDVVNGDLPWDLLSRRAREATEALLEDLTPIAGDGLPLEQLPDGRFRVWTFAGGLANAVLREALAATPGCSPRQPQQLYLDLICREGPEATRDALRAALQAPPSLPDTERLQPLKLAEALSPASLRGVYEARYLNRGALSRLAAAGIRLVQSPPPV